MKPRKMTMEEFLEYGIWDMRPKKGDPKIDLRGLVDYCREHNIPKGENGYPEEIVEKFVIGVYEYGREDVEDTFCQEDAFWTEGAEE